MQTGKCSFKTVGMTCSKDHPVREVDSQSSSQIRREPINPSTTWRYIASIPFTKVPRVPVIEELVEKGETEIELLKAVKDIFASSSQEVERVAQRDTLRAAAESCLPRALEICLFFLCASRGVEAARELDPLGLVLRNRRDRPQFDVSVRHLAAFRVAVSGDAFSMAEVEASAGFPGRHWLDNASTLAKKSDFSFWSWELPPAKAGIARLPFGIVGHSRVALEVLDAVATHLMVPAEETLVVLFSGSSGCGKTRLAEGIASALADDPLDETASIKISCSSAATHTEVFGLGGAYVGSEKGSPLNNFICSRKGRPGVVILDEFEKLGSKAQLGFLEPWGTGDWVDKRLTETFTRNCDCTNIVFVLTTNMKLPDGDVEDLKDALPFKDEINGRITHAMRFPDLSSKENDLLAASGLTRAQRIIHFSKNLPLSKIQDFEWRFKPQDGSTVQRFVVSANIQRRVKKEGSRPINS